MSAPENEESIVSKDYWKTVGLEVKETVTAPAHWEGRDWLLFSGVTAGIVAVGVFDEDIQRAVQRNRNRTTDNIFNAVEPFGTGYSAAVRGAFYLGGELFKDPSAKSVALDGLSASIIASGLIAQPLKYTFGRNRPNKGHGAYVFQPFSGNDSFPSGHTTQAFAVATVISEHYDSLWVQGASYGLASMVGYARLNHNAHWASDVVAGAAIGTVVGRFVVHFNQQHHSVSFAPILGPGMQGGALTWAF
ncbi:MAG: hypothetical protein DME25_13610 [Verrucomicrobia bacterium]|nr:MAG: hypothetical protein DME25_13610 [Verrucomicrobiota bacterium]